MIAVAAVSGQTGCINHACLPTDSFCLVSFCFIPRPATHSANGFGGSEESTKVANRSKKTHNLDDRSANLMALAEQNYRHIVAVDG